MRTITAALLARMDAAGAAGAADARAAALREQEAGNTAVGRGDWVVASARYDASLALFATAAAFSNRAACHLALGRPAEAASDARAALALDAGFVRAYVRLSAALRAQGDDAAALAAAREGLARAEAVASPLVAQLREAAEAASRPRRRAAEPKAQGRYEHLSEAARANVRTLCAHCGETLRDRRLCAACRQVAYCNEACQRLGWSAHREACAIAAPAMASAADAAGMSLPRGKQANAVLNWAAASPAHWLALQTLAWTVQHSPVDPGWGIGAVPAGAVHFSVLRGAGDQDTLRVMLLPSALLGLADSRGSGARASLARVMQRQQMAGVAASLGRVDVQVGFLVGVEDRRMEIAGGMQSVARVRYSVSTDLLAELGSEALRERRMRVDGVNLRAEVDVQTFRDLLEEAGV